MKRVPHCIKYNGVHFRRTIWVLLFIEFIKKVFSNRNDEKREREIGQVVVQDNRYESFV